MLNGPGVKNFSKKVLDKRDEVWYHKNVPPMRRVPCKLNNVTNEKHQTEAVLKNCNQESLEYAVESITRKERR